MPELAMAMGAILVGFVGLIWSADRFVDGSASIAGNLGLSPMVIGLTIVALGTSAPEILVSISAGLRGAENLAVGNALGSNLANIGLVLGVTALIATLPIKKFVLINEVPVLLFVTALAGLVLFDGKLSVSEGYLLLGFFLPVMLFLVLTKKFALNRGEKSMENELTEVETIPSMAFNRALMWFFIGLLLLIGSSEILVWGAQKVAIRFGVDPLIIGLTVVAVGTSLPELAASVASALKSHHDIALGNIIGSNIFNLLAVLAIPGFFSASGLPETVFSRDYFVMAAITSLLCVCMIINYARSRHKEQAGIGKLIGITLLACYTAYYVLLFQTL